GSFKSRCERGRAMHSLRFAVVIALLFAVATGANAADKAAKKAAKKGLRGVISSVEKETDKNAGKLTIKVMSGTKGNTQTEEKTYSVTESTKIQTMTGKPKDNQLKDGAFSDLAKNKMVMFTTKDNTIDSIKVSDKTKKKAK